MAANPASQIEHASPTAIKSAVAPTPLRPIETPKPIDELSQFTKALAQADVMVNEFPDAFADAATLRAELLDLKNQNRLLIQIIPAGNQLVVAQVQPIARIEKGILKDLYPTLTI